MPKNPVKQRNKGKGKKNPLPPTNERKDRNAQPTNASSNVEQKKPPLNAQPIVIVEQPPPIAVPSPITIPSPEVKVADFSVKHPLNSKWTLWYYYPEKNAEWEKCQHRIYTIDTVEDFWSLVDHVKPPSELGSGVDYSFFKNGIRPMWEDPQNVKGGRLTVISVPKSKSPLIDEVWLDVLIFLIGENHSNADNVCGVVLNTRQYGFKLAVWTSVQDRTEVGDIGQSIKSGLSTSFVQTIPFEEHSDTQKKAQTYNKSSSRGPAN